MSDCQGTNYVRKLEVEHGINPINNFEKIEDGFFGLGRKLKVDIGESEYSDKTDELTEKTRKFKQDYKEVRDKAGNDPSEINLPFKNQKERNYQLSRLKVTFFLVLMIFFSVQSYLIYWDFYYEEAPLDERLEPLILSSRKKIDQARLEKSSFLIRFLWKLELRIFLLANEILKVWVGWGT